MKGIAIFAEKFPLFSQELHVSVMGVLYINKVMIIRKIKKILKKKL